MNTEICVAIIQGVFGVIAALTTAWFALFLYRKQKEYDLVKQRYLDGSIDILASEVDNSLGIYNHNWARCLNILKSYRDAPDLFDVNELKHGYIEYESVKFNEIAHHRLHTLTGSLVYWKIYQKTMAFITNSVSIIQHEIPDTIKAKLTTDSIQSEHAEIVEHAFNVLKELQNESFRFAEFSKELRVLSSALEQEQLSIKNIYKFKNKSVVINSINNIENTYKDDLGEDEDIA